MQLYTIHTNSKRPAASNCFNPRHRNCPKVISLPVPKCFTIVRDAALTWGAREQPGVPSPHLNRLQRGECCWVQPAAARSLWCALQLCPRAGPGLIVITGLLSTAPLLACVRLERTNSFGVLVGLCYGLGSGRSI